MQTVLAKSSMLVRSGVILPPKLKLKTIQFTAPWNVVVSADAGWLEREVTSRNWHIVRIANGIIRSGIGNNSHTAIASAVNFALMQVNSGIHTLRIEHVKLTQYPWFVLACISMSPYRIQEGLTLTEADAAIALTFAPRHRRVSAPYISSYLKLGTNASAMKDILTVNKQRLIQ